MKGTRGSAPAVGLVLLLAITVVGAGIVGVSVIGIADDLEGPAPQNVETEDRLLDPEGHPAACGEDTVRISHVGGEEVDLSETFVLVRTPDGPESEARLGNLPAEGRTFDDEIVYDPDDVINDNCVRGVVADGDGDWTAGTRIQFDLNSGGGTLEPGDRVEVVVVHEPTGAIVVDTQLRMEPA